MSSYGHPQSYRRSAGGAYDAYDEYGHYQDAYARDSYGADPYPADSYAQDSYARDSYGGDPYGRDVYARRGHSSAGYGDAAGHAASARAGTAVGAASAGRASVPGSPGAVPAGSPASADEYGGAPRPRYDWSGGSAGRGSAGRASVPVSPGAGPVGRASVRPGGPAGGGPGKAGAGSGSAGGPPGGKRKKHWLRNSLLSGLAVLVIMTGGGMVALSYYVESVPPPQELDLEEASTIYFADDSEMAVMQKVNREIIDTTTDELANVRNAVVAAEDKDFFDHSGVDFMGITRAAVNNLRGGDRQGASTIDQQYAGAAADIRSEATYSRKLEEAAMAYKMNQDHSKLEILDFYLNTIYFGRGAYGIQAAAQAYFGMDADELGVSEAAVLAGVIRTPASQTTEESPYGLSPYDPLHNPDDPQFAFDRWGYVLNQMVDIGAVTPEERAELTELPEAIEPSAQDEPYQGPQGPIVEQVRLELSAMGIDDLTTGGYRVKTTIDPELQEAALDAARRGNDGAHWESIEDNVDAALVAIDPETGAVRAYYGGEDGQGYDLARGDWNAERGMWEGGRPPGSSFKIYTLIAALREGVSVQSHWKTSEYEPDWLDSGDPIRNAGRDARDTGCEGVAPDYCTLRWSTEHSFNVPFAQFSENAPNGPALITQAAMDAGITMMRDTRDGEYHNLREIGDATEVAPEHFFHPVAYGQYPVTVLDHASGVATLAARGMYHKPHFVDTVEQRVDGEWVPVETARINGEEKIETALADAVTGVLDAVPEVTGVPLADGRPAAAKTGTWEHDEGGNADAWMVGYTPQLASAVWVGDGEDADPIRDEFGNNIGSSGLPSQIWKQFMDAAHSVKGWEVAQFPDEPPVGEPQHEYATGEQPQPETREPGDPRCRLPFVSCPEPDEDDGRGDEDGPPPPPDEDDEDREEGGGLLPGPDPGGDD